jgi:hypothetical protein
MNDLQVLIVILNKSDDLLHVFFRKSMLVADHHASDDSVIPAIQAIDLCGGYIELAVQSFYQRFNLTALFFQGPAARD